MDAFCAPQVEEVVCMKSARIGWTKILGNVIGYHVDQDPCSMLVVQPTIEDAEGYSREEIAPMIAETPCLRARFIESKSRTSSSTIMKKSYPGGILHLIGANSPRGFRRISVRIVLFDEPDGYPETAGLEGDQIKLGAKRAETFWNRKIGIGSTPTVRGASRIESEFETASKGYYLLDCPHCETSHVRRFRQGGFLNAPIVVRGEALPESWLHWEKDNPRSAAWMCGTCGSLIFQKDHRHMIERGRWYGEEWEYRDGEFTFLLGFDGRIGFSIWAGYSYSPNSTPAKLAREFIDSAKDPEKLKTYVNTVLGETWKEAGEQSNPHTLASRAEVYPAEVPPGVITLKLGADVQQDRIEAEVVGWGAGEESWSIDYIVMPGDPGGDEVWDDLKDVILHNKYKTQTGQYLGISGACIDAGYLQARVVRFVLRLKLAYVWATKGRDGRFPLTESRDERMARIRRRRAKRGGLRPELIGADEGKMRLYRALLVDKPGPRYCHFPEGRAKEWYHQLAAEEWQTIGRGTSKRKAWVKVRERNEALDCRILAWAALELSGDDLDAASAALAEPQAPRTARPTRKRAGGFGSSEWRL